MARASIELQGALSYSHRLLRGQLEIIWWSRGDRRQCGLWANL